MFGLQNPELKLLEMKVAMIIVILSVLYLTYTILSEKQRKKVEEIEDEWFAIIKYSYRNGLKQSYDLATCTISNKYYINKCIIRHFLPYNEEDLKEQLEFDTDMSDFEKWVNEE